MKKSLVFLMTLTLLLCSATMAMAGSFYFDYMPSGSITPNTFDYQNVTLFDIGVSVPIDRFVISAEYNSGSFDLGAVSGYDLNGYEVDFGYTLVDNEDVDFTVFLGYGNRDVNHLIDYSVDGFMLGCDLTVSFSEEASLDLNLAMGINGRYTDELDNDEDADVFRYNLRFNYFFDENVGVSVGYRSDSFTPESGTKYDFKGFTLGMGFKF